MAHSIDIIIVTSVELEKIKLVHEIKYVHLNQGFYAIFNAGPDEIKDLNGLHVTTDYFGGLGDQTATWYHTGKVLIEHGSINEALKALGVVCESDRDEYATLRLGKYRNNNAFEKDCNSTDLGVSENDPIPMALFEQKAVEAKNILYNVYCELKEFEKNNSEYRTVEGDDNFYIWKNKQHFAIVSKRFWCTPYLEYFSKGEFDRCETILRKGTWAEKI